MYDGARQLNGFLGKYPILPAPCTLHPFTLHPCTLHFKENILFWTLIPETWDRSHDTGYMDTWIQDTGLKIGNRLPAKPALAID